MRAALALEAAEIARIARHYMPLGRVLRVSAELAAVVGMVAAVAIYGIATTTPAPRGVVIIAEAAR